MTKFEDTLHQELTRPTPPTPSATEQMTARMAEYQRTWEAQRDTPESVRFRELLAQMAAQLSAYSVPTEPHYLGVGVSTRSVIGFPERPLYEKGFRQKIRDGNGWYLSHQEQDPTSPNALIVERLFLQDDGKFAYQPHSELPAQDRGALWARPIDITKPLSPSIQDIYIQRDTRWYAMVERDFWHNTVPTTVGTGYYLNHSGELCRYGNLIDDNSTTPHYTEVPYEALLARMVANAIRR